MTTTELQGYYFDYITKIPNFIDAKKSIDMKLWDVIFTTSELLSVLITDKIFTENQIEIVSNDFNELSHIVIDLTHQIEVWAYYDILIRDLINISVKSELFEPAANLDAFYKKNFID